MTEIHRAPLGIREAAVIQHLQQHIEHIGMGLLHLVKQEQGIGPTAHRFGELATLLVADIAGGCAEQARHGIALHEFAHVETHKRLLFIEQQHCQGFGELGLSHPRGAEKQKRANGAPGILHPSAGPADRRSHRLHRLRLTDHPLAQMSLELQQFLALSSHQPLDGNARPACDDIGNVTGLHLLAQQRRALGLGLRKRLFQILTPLLHPMQLVIFQPGSLFKITTALGFGHRMAQVFIVLKQLTQFGQLITLRLPAFSQLFQA